MALLLSLTACDNKLNLEPANTISAGQALATSTDVEALLVGGYDAFGGADLYGGNLQRDAELLGDRGEVFWDGTFVAPGEIFDKKMTRTNDQAAETWLDGYRAINIANTVIANVGLVDAAKRDRVKAEAQFIRGSLYFELVRQYAKTWGDGDNATNPGVPIVLTPTLTITPANKIPRNTVAEVYAQVIQDLTEAEAKLPATNGFYATKGAAGAMLSRVYLQQLSYVNAANAADRVIKSGRYQLVDTESVFDLRTNISGINTPETILATQVTDQDGANSLITFYAASDFGGRGDIYIEDRHLALYDAADNRGGLFYEDAATGGVRTAKYVNRYGNIQILRLAEMYLTRAEANFRSTGQIGATPLADINLIRSRAGLSPLTSAQLTLAAILRERRLELAFEGTLIHDLKRNRQSTANQTGTLPWNSPALIFPIPQREIDANSSLIQNEAYR